jgi:hypothetical protein
MNDVTDGQLPDVREISIADLASAVPGSALGQALERILGSRPECNFGFTNFIS